MKKLLLISLIIVGCGILQEKDCAGVAGWTAELDKTESYFLQALELTNNISDDMYKKHDKARVLNMLAVVYVKKIC